MSQRNEAPDFKKMGVQVMDQVRRYSSITALNFFKDSFKKQGWHDGSITPWPARKDTDAGRGILIKTGSLRNSLRVKGRSNTSIRFANDEPYANIHNEGGTIRVPITKKMRGYFWFMFKKTKNEKWKWMALSKKKHLNMRIPQRQFLGHSETLMNDLSQFSLDLIKTAFKRS
jgi:phage gpG-like protein